MESDTSRNIVVGVAGGIAAYKACHLVRNFTEHGDRVRVVPTSAALNFVGAATFEALSGQPVSTTVFDAVDEVAHVRIGQEADGIVIAPATADLIARIASGRADDLLSATVLVATCPIVVAPAMHTEMWLNPATQANVATLRSRGIVVLEPAHGRLTGKDSGAGRLLEPEQIASLSREVFNGSTLPHTWSGKKVLITAGGTQENLDPVRYLGNRSSGQQGFALAEIAAQRGAEVSIIAANTDRLPTPAGAKITSVRSARDMLSAVIEQAPQQDIIIMAAAVADYRPHYEADMKLKKGKDDSALGTLALTENPDILRHVVKMRDQGSLNPEAVIVGFAAETGDEHHSAEELAVAKLARKGCDLLMCNEVGEGKVFGQPLNSGVLLLRGEDPAAPVRRTITQGSKLSVAIQILDAIDGLGHCQN
ncbi:bifunctional phosphopantothenoylcysteine decarboxylase/phosphopantothenate--cysteine ligase CoaBC [Corynebacterium sp. 3HC-13]|uniref:bifunctional phosphopantothenoylcysteine decarboxylase/phosphopantothenate--cysteine ligase CoaBC n=1 Tax=Corynebacterium poyangense TaxID=2684405 RepID=UPI001CCDC3D7|nr:bifunctional phosphopantothenoylcysteine decarboxylase/phosphopantothenate--cysteine ligase CoaBC [Corynebacterium poyangense]MBZ8177856.1 bifunctional phosphopantothenoylcysteine decarboxylase/phosphopantothenate--cysteine ligase CoaBC [Corynebacterium poyangense]